MKPILFFLLVFTAINLKGMYRQPILKNNFAKKVFFNNSNQELFNHFFFIKQSFTCSKSKFQESKLFSNYINEKLQKIANQKKAIRLRIEVQKIMLEKLESDENIIKDGLISFMDFMEEMDCFVKQMTDDFNKEEYKDDNTKQ